MHELMTFWIASDSPTQLQPRITSAIGIWKQVQFVYSGISVSTAGRGKSYH
jgi:hypothetical protein